MSIQGVFNTRVNEKAGLWCTTTIVNAIALVCSIVALLFFKDVNLVGLKEVNKLYLLGGVLGVGITLTVMLSMGQLGPAYATMIILIAQMVTSYLVDCFGWFDTPKVGFVWTKLIGVVVMIAGIIIFQLDLGK